MDLQRSLLLNWTYFHQQKSMDELKMRDEEISQLKGLLRIAIKERDEAQEKCQNVFLDLLLLQQKLHQSTPHSRISSIEDDPRKGMDSNNGFSSSDCDESIVSSPHHLPAAPPPVEAETEELSVEVQRPLPEKGKFLQAVRKAGPLLQDLLLAGPLPQWHHPPPPVDTCKIPPPPVVVPLPRPLPTQFDDINHCGEANRKRSLSENCDSSIELKYRRIVLR